MSKPQWKVGDTYSKEVASSNEVTRKDTLESVAYNVDEGPYTRTLTKTELENRKDQLAEVSIKLAEIEVRRKELMAEIKAEKAEPEAIKMEMIESIKHKTEFREGILYNVEDYDNGLMYIFDRDAICVEVRGLRPSEKQTTMHIDKKNGTNE